MNCWCSKQINRHLCFSFSRTTIAAGLFAVAFLQAHDAYAQGWYNSNWLYRKKITIDYTKVGSTGAPHANFPVLISFTSDANLSASARSDGFDILFTSSDGTTKVDYDREEYSSGTLVAWVRIPSLSASANTDIYMYYGNSGASDQQNKADTWNEGGNNYFKGIWHLNQATGGTGAILDATSNNNNGTDYGTPGFQAGGQIGYAIDFDGSADYVAVDDAVSLDPVNALTISGWFYFDTDIGSVRLISKEKIGSWSYRLLTLDNGAFGFNDGLLIQLSSNGIANSVFVQINNALTLFKDRWVFLSATYNGSTARLYVNATQIGSNNGSISIYDSDTKLGIGASGDGSWPLNGLIDEVRVSSVARSAGWILTDYNNQNSPSTFYSVGVQQAATYTWDGGGGDNNWSTAANWNPDGAPFNDGTPNLVMAGVVRLTPNTDVAWDFLGLTFDNTAGAFTLGGSQLTVRANGITNNSTNLQTIGNNIVLNVGQTWNATSGDILVSGIVSGSSVTLTKSGAGLLTLSGANTYGGSTTINAGRLRVNNISGSGTGTGAVTVGAGGTLSGSGTVTGAVTLSGTVEPGANTGTLNTGTVNLSPGGHYIWEINQADGAKGTATGWDWLSSTGQFNVNSTSGNPFTIHITSLDLTNAPGPAANFNNAQSYTWTIATGNSGFNNYAANKFVIDASAFQNPTNGGTFSLQQSNNDLNLVFTPGVYYSKGNLAVNTPANWNTARDGTGSNATAFSANIIWVMQNGHAMTLSGAAGWNVTASGTVQIENGGSWTNSSSGAVTIGTFQIDNGGTYVHSSGNALPGTTKTFGATSTVNYAGSTQTVAVVTYGHLTVSAAGTKTLAGNVNVGGDLTISAGILDLVGFTANRSSAGGTLSVANGATLRIGGTNSFPTNYSTRTLGATSTVEYNGAAQSVVGETYGHLALSNGNTKTAAAAVTIAGDLTIAPTTTFVAGGYTHVVQGDWTNSGTFTAGTSTIQLTGSSASGITGATTFNVLEVNKSAGSTTVTLNNNVSTATLTMTQGKISTGSNAITVTSDRTGNGLVIGTITRTHTFSAGPAYAFEGPYNTLTFASGGTLPTSVTVTTTLSSPGANGSMDPIDRYYDISEVGGSGFTYTLRLHYEDSEVSAPNSETSPPLKIWRRTSTGPDVWERKGATGNSTVDNWVEVSGMTETGVWSLSSTTVGTMALTLSQDKTNPSPGEQVTYTISYLNTGDGTATSTLINASAPANTTYATGSVVLNGVGKTDVADADEVTVTGPTIAITLGSVSAGASGTVTYRVSVN